MSEESALGIYTCVTKPVVGVYFNLVKPRAFGPKGKERGEPKYSANFYFDPEDQQFKDIRDIAIQVARGFHGNNVDLKSLAWPWKSGTAKADAALAKKRKKDPNAEPNPVDEAGRGKYVISARSKFRPQLSYYDAASRRIVKLEDEAAIVKAQKKFFYFGVEVLPQFKFQGYTAVDDRDPDGVNTFLQQVFSTGKGEKLGGDVGGADVDVFSGYVGSLSGEDPTGGQQSNEGLDDVLGGYAPPSRGQAAFRTAPGYDDDIPF